MLNIRMIKRIANNAARTANVPIKTTAASITLPDPYPSIQSSSRAVARLRGLNESPNNDVRFLMPVSLVTTSDTVDIVLDYIIETTFVVTAENFFKIAE